MTDASAAHIAPLGQGLRSEAAATPKGEARAARILTETLKVIAEQGYQALTLDEVARRVGIAKGNLQYYYPTRSNLLQAAFAEQIERHKSIWTQSADRPAHDPVTRLRRQVAFELAVNRDTDFVSQVLERWSLAQRDAALQELNHGWRDWVVARYAAMIGAIRPDLDHAVRTQLAVMLYAMVVGTPPHAGRYATDNLVGLEQRVEDTIMHMVESAS